MSYPLARRVNHPIARTVSFYCCITVLIAFGCLIFLTVNKVEKLWIRLQYVRYGPRLFELHTHVFIYPSPECLILCTTVYDMLVSSQVWRKTRTGRKKMAVKWLRELEKEYPHLARTARRLNTEDGFVMDHQGRRGSDHDRDGDDGRQKGKKSNKRSNTRDNTQSNSLGKRRKRESDGDSPSSRSGTSSS